MKKQVNAALIGCGDYVRWLIDDLNASKILRIKYTFDLDPAKANLRAGQFGATALTSDELIFSDAEIDVVLIFTPPWARRALFIKAIENGKNIITVKPLSSNYADALELYTLVGDKVKCAVFYGRTGNTSVETIKRILDSGEIGKLHLFKEDWFHHYPTWNKWAIDPAKNGGPFMDAMIHCLNKARYLIGSEVTASNFFSENHAQKLPCNDTEGMRVIFENGASAHLFITWAANLEIYNPDANEREHIGILHLITDQGWYITEETENDKPIIKARNNGEVRTWEVQPLLETPWDDFALSVLEDRPISFPMISALKDIEILEKK